MTITKQISLNSSNNHDSENLPNNNDSNKIKISKKVVKKLTIVERLNLARKEVILERKLDQLKLESINQSKTQAILKAQQLLENLPAISTLNSSSQSQSQLQSSPSSIFQSSNAKLSSSLPTQLVEQSFKSGTISTDVGEGRYLVSFSYFLLKKEKYESEKRNRLQREQNFDGIPKKVFKYYLLMISFLYFYF